jgi:hypothetical protein
MTGENDMPKKWKMKPASEKEMSAYAQYAQTHKTNTQVEIKKLIKELDKTKAKLIAFDKSYPCNQIRTTKLAQNLLLLVDKICNLEEKIIGEM